MKTFADADLTVEEHDAWLAGYGHGFGDGIDRGRQLEATDLAEDWSALAAKIRRAADHPTRAELTDRRRWAS